MYFTLNIPQNKFLWKTLSVTTYFALKLHENIQQQSDTITINTYVPLAVLTDIHETHYSMRDFHNKYGYQAVPGLLANSCSRAVHSSTDVYIRRKTNQYFNGEGNDNNS